MVYPTRGQEAAAQRLAQMPKMGARLQNVGKQLTQQDRLERARQGGREMAKRIAKANQDYFASQRGGPQPQQRTEFTPRVDPVLQQPMQAAAPAIPQRPIARGQTTQRSWNNYTGPNPIKNFDYEVA
jgi:hypothetical protein